MFLFDIWEVWILGSALCPEELAMLWEKQIKEKWQSIMVFTVTIKTGDFLDPRLSCDPENSFPSPGESFNSGKFQDLSLTSKFRPPRESLHY